jgi:undecaprenyl diphosphate synthase
MDYKFRRIPKHIGIIPDGNRRWALNNSLAKHEGYDHGITPGFEIYELMLQYGIKEATFYGFTMDNTKRPKIQSEAFSRACIDAVNKLANRDANLLVIGNTNSKVFPNELRKYANKRVNFGRGLININFLVNYDWSWDLGNAITSLVEDKVNIYNRIASSDISRIDLIIRWGGRRRLSGFLPVQSVYSDFYVIEDYWPDFKKEHFYEALRWYQDTDITLGG